MQTQELKVNSEEKKLRASNIIFEPKEKFKSYCAGNISNQYKNWKTITSDKYIRGIVKRGLTLSFNKDKFNNIF